ncbi:MAG: Na(+)-translocating NADH-quinone reductase subunit C [Pseudohongiellaceae bacterium]
MSSKDSVRQTLLVAFLLCLVCSIVVSGTAVILKPMQDDNKLLDRQKNILAAAGLFDSQVHTNADVGMLFEQFTPLIVDLDESRLVSENELDALGIDPVTYDPRDALTDPDLSNALPRDEDIANIKRRVRYTTVYVVAEDGGTGFETIVLPISGYGLWGILYGYLALEGDANTVTGIGFYELKETPGLGAEVMNPRWQGQWPGKEIYDGNGRVAIDVVQGGAAGDHEIDGLAGATLTSRGVENIIQFWMGENGFRPFLEQFRPSGI